MLIQLVQSFVIVVCVRNPIYGICDVKFDGFQVRILDFKSPIFERVVTLHDHTVKLRIDLFEGLACIGGVKYFYIF
jgi:hypothetical protein